MTRLPALFVSHDAPNMVLHDRDARDFLSTYASGLPRPTGIVVVSAHFETKQPAAVTDAAPETVYDFGGFEPEVYEIQYPAPDAPALAERVAEALDAERIANRGFDHGSWVPLMLLYPDADIPVVQVSVQPAAGPAHHHAIGRALAPFRDEGVLILVSGSFSHNLGELFRQGGLPAMDAPDPGWVAEFTDWFAARLVTGDTDALLDYRRQAPHAARNNPTEEHLLPVFVAMGAAGGAAEHIHASTQYGVIRMDAFAFA